MPTVLIIDDNLSVATALDVSLSLHDLDCVITTSTEQGMDYLTMHSIDLVIQDMNFSADTTSGQEGVALFKRIRAHSPDMPVILMTAWTHLDMAVELIKAGAADYIAKPWDDQRLITTVRNLIELGQANRTLQRRNQRELQQKQALEADFDLCGLIWQDRATAKVLEVACQVARSDAAILITGPNGAGKERIAEIVQRNSAVCDGPFVILNCGALPAELIEAELFGSESGAYTGAMKAREGKFEAADGGTLFLDEIGNLPLAGQMKLLRVLETGRFQRLGANRERQVSVRIISATNADLPAMIKAGQFREDLYYRLNVIQLHLPALAARPDDILPLARAFLGKDKHLSEAACAALLAHSWPGNVRELKNLMQRAQLLSSAAQITVTDLGLSSAVAAKGIADNEPDKAAIEQALTQAEGVIAQAAAALGLSRQSLYRRMDRFGIPRLGAGSGAGSA
ncbi:sigma-54-dependent transcriptional regulator [Undibacterium rugosum]|uniref:Sigma-54-dependent Fis family transcriptional regulator n=1 Tax=Undibacterium rugosum TaxID=2762291 RepID=A0A923KZ98_9BURK|nr:sigma-54 dependent transcriptional regulator [Undibacterium rugosum]MBC3935673.1 sigma-54-dependent Fis family transcriptional regulator [Undibacterium rugosum]MBR7778564.1 sigma-54-dependent Fis family transcriptional regulator [Undibacterium rugosum]